MRFRFFESYKTFYENFKADRFKLCYTIHNITRKEHPMPTISEILAAELNQKLTHIENVIALLDEGNTVPFIARYRKELHGAMDDTVLRTLETRLNYLRGLQQRREEVLHSIESQNKLTPELTRAVNAAQTLAEVHFHDPSVDRKFDHEIPPYLYRIWY